MKTGTLFATKAKGSRYLQLTEGYITKQYLDADNETCGTWRSTYGSLAKPASISLQATSRRGKMTSPPASCNVCSL